MSEPAEINQNTKKVNSWKDIFDAIMIISCIIMFCLSLYTRFTNGRNFEIYAIITAFIFMYCASVTTKYGEDKMSKFKERLGDVEIDSENQSKNKSDIETFEVSYLGGHPSRIAKHSIGGTIGLSKSKIGFIDNLYNGSFGFEINLDDISEVSEETQESLTLGRFLMVGVLSLALKKKHKYLRLSFKNGIGEISTIIFETSEAEWIKQIITKRRYDYIISKNETTVIESPQ